MFQGSAAYDESSLKTVMAALSKIKDKISEHFQLQNLFGKGVEVSPEQNELTVLLWGIEHLCKQTDTETIITLNFGNV